MRHLESATDGDLFIINIHNETNTELCFSSASIKYKPLKANKNKYYKHQGCHNYPNPPSKLTFDFTVLIFFIFLFLCI